MRRFTLAALGALVVLFPVVASAQVRIDVANVAQLQQAFATADANPDIYYSVFLARLRNSQGQPVPWAPTTTFNLTKGKLFLYGSDTGVNPERYVIDGQNITSIVQGQVRRRGLFRIEGDPNGYRPPVFGISGVTVQNAIESVLGGGVIFATNAEYISVERSVIRNNQGHLFAGAVRVENTKTSDIYQSIFDGNLNDQPPVCLGGQTGGGGALGFRGKNRIYVTNSSFVNNRSCRGGAIEFNGGNNTTDITNSTFSANTAARRGGALLFSGGTGVATIRFNTIVNNTAGTLGWSPDDQNFGGGIALATYAGVISVSGTVIAKNKVMSQNWSAYGFNTDDCYTQNPNGLSSFRGNILGRRANCNFGAVGDFGIGSDSQAVDPQLESLQYLAVSHGFPLPMHKPLANSPVRLLFKASEFFFIEFSDQRAYSRPHAFGGEADAGSVEFDGER